jgi:xanthine dehydrogenase molybdenum-binding subunit
MVQSLALDIVALLSKKARRPVKLVFSREEEFTCTETRHPAVVHLKTGVKKDGTLLARHSRSIYDTGAYAGHGPFVYSRAMRSLALWKCSNIRYEGTLVYTNKPVAGAMRGYGNPQHTFAVELQNDEIAQELGIDPMEWRLKNHIRVGDVNKSPARRIPDAPPGEDWKPAFYKIESCGLSESILKGAEKIGWKEKRNKPSALDGSKRRGIGMACGMHTSGTMPTPRVSSAYVRIREDGKISLVSGGCDHGGTGQHTVIAQIAADELGVPLEDIVVTAEDTDTTPFDSGTAGASGGTYTVGGAVLDAIADLKRKLLRQVSFMLRTEIKDLEIMGGGVHVKGDPERGLSFREIAQRAQVNRHPYAMLEGDGYHYYPPTNAPPFFVDFIEVEVDIETGEVKVLKVVAAHDSGRAINPMFFEGQVQGGIQQGIGYALTEELVIDKETGRPLNPTFLDYNMLRATDMPEIEILIIETNEPTGPHGAKGLGEPCSVAVAPAIANAIFDAIGVRMKELPMTPERILQGLRENKEK